MSEFNSKLGLIKNARSPGSIFNSQHHDPSSSERSMNGSAGTISVVIPDSTVETAIPPNSVIRVCNTTGATAFIYIGEEGTVPGSIDALSSYAIPPNSAENFFCGISRDPSKSIVIKASVIGVQVIVQQ